MQAKLTTIADLTQPTEVKQPFISRAMELSGFYEKWKAQDDGGYEYTVDVPGGGQRAPGVHASELKCQLALVYSLMGIERRRPTGNVNMEMRFRLGTATHATLQFEFGKMCEWLGEAVTFQDEVSIHPDLGGVAAQYSVYSHCDGFFTFHMPDNLATPYLRVGIEIKTKSEKEYAKLVRPEEDHLEQTCLYMKALDLPLMWFIYYNKSNSNYTGSSPPYLLQFDQALWEKKVEPKIAGAHEHVRKGTLPPRTESYACRWCPFAWTCNPTTVHRRKYGPSATALLPGAMR